MARKEHVDGCYPMGKFNEGELHRHCWACDKAPARSDACQAFRSIQIRLFFTED